MKPFAPIVFLTCAVATLSSAFSLDSFAQDDATVPETVTPEEEATDDGDAPPGNAKPEPFWKRIVPVPIVITEPAVGEGLGLALGYFHATEAESARSQTPAVISGEATDDLAGPEATPPTVTGVFGGVTNNETQFAGLGHSTTFLRDHVRLNVAGGWANVVADYYLLDVPFEFNLEGIMLYADTRVRIGDTPFFWGLGTTVLDADNTFRLPLPDRPPIGVLAFDFIDVGVSGRLMYDTRDDTLFPRDGQLVDLTIAVHDDAVGGDYDYVHTRLKALGYHAVNERWVLSGRLDLQMVDGDPPFFAVPYTALRGIPALRYQGERTAVGELEVRYRFAERWTALAFGGLGWREQGPRQPNDSIYNYGIGGRFKALKSRSVWLGLDIARGPEDTYWYIQVGQAW